MVDNAPSVDIVRYSKNPVDAREKTSNRGRNSLVWPAPDDGAPDAEAGMPRDDVCR